MDYLSASILSGIVYDCIKKGIKISADKLKERLRNWLIEDDLALLLSNELNELQLDDEMSEIAIERKISSSGKLLNLVNNVNKSNKNNNISQVHYGTGDNVGGDKIVR